MRNKLRPFLFMIGEKNKLRSEVSIEISQMLIETTSPPDPKTLKVSVSGDTIKIDQTNVTIKIDDTNPFGGFKPNEPDTKDIEEKLRQIEEEKRLLEEEKKKIEEANRNFLKMR